MKAKCTCGNKFEVELKETTKRVDNDTLFINYIECPDCNKRTLSSVTTKTIQERIQNTHNIDRLKQQEYINHTREMMRGIETEYKSIISEVIPPYHNG